LRGQAADRDPAVLYHVGGHGIADRAADILEIDIDPVRAEGAQPLLDILMPVIDGMIEAEIVGQPSAFLRRAGYFSRS